MEFFAEGGGGVQPESKPFEELFKEPFYHLEYTSEDVQKACQRGSREILIFEGAIFLIWNHPFYCLFRQSVFKTVFVFKIGPILVVGIKM